MQRQIELTDTQAANIAEILMQYAPEGWLKLTMLFKTNDELTQIDTWAETTHTADHGFQLDGEDADAVEAILGDIWEQSNKTWELAEYSIDCEGNFAVSFE